MCYKSPVTSDSDNEGPKRRGKKERVLHTRVPAVLEQELKRLANAWRVPVSNVVRTILEDALDTVDVVSRKAEGELRGVAQKLASERYRLREKSAGSIDAIEKLAEAEGSEDEPAVQQETPRQPLDGAVGFTPIILANDAVCAVSGKELPAGSEALLVLFEDPGRQEIVGRDALSSRSKQE